MDGFDENPYQNRFNTPLAPAQRRPFQDWAARKGYIPQAEANDYDLQGAYLAGVRQADNGHLTDQFKKPNHPTFSEQSQYSGVNTFDGRPTPRGGRWDVPQPLEQALTGTRPSFTMSAEMTRDGVPVHSQDNMRQYLNQREFGTDLLLPYPPYRQAGLRR